MKNKILLYAVGVLSLTVVFLLAYIHYTAQPPIIEQETEVTTTKTDTVFIKVNNYVEVKADTLKVDKKAKADNVNIDIAEYRYFPQHELLSGWVDISYTYSDTTFTIKDRQIIKQITNTVETVRTVSKVQMVKPHWIRFKLGGAYYKRGNGNILQINCGVNLFNRLDVLPSCLLIGKEAVAGLQVNWTF